MITTVAAVLALAVVPFLPLPARESWPFLGAGVLLQVLYFVLLARTYRIAEMSQAYPVMRGIAPLLVAAASVFLLAEPLSWRACLGVAVVATGILSMAARPPAGQGRGLALALLNGCVIASYTIVDGLGVRRSGAPVAYTLWIFLLAGIPLAVWPLVARRREFLQYVRDFWHLGIVGGAGSVTSYGLALWAMTVAPIAMVSALRETSILFGIVISAVFLKEAVPRMRIVAACIVVCGVVLIRLG